MYELFEQKQFFLSCTSNLGESFTFPDMLNLKKLLFYLVFINFIFS